MPRKQKQKYKPLSDATPEELMEAMKIASYWLADEQYLSRCSRDAREPSDMLK